MKKKEITILNFWIKITNSFPILELKNLEKVAKVRMNHCSARINLDEARILGKKGEHVAAAEKFTPR